MKVEIWSDVMCPFCYIGKRRFEKALEDYEFRDEVEVIWKSYQLDPSLQTDPSKSIHEHLAESKGWSLEYARQMNDYVTEMAKGSGLEYHMDKAVVANSFDAHRFSHLAREYGKQNEAEEKLFAAYFTEGKNTADHEVLVQLGEEIGLDPAEIRETLSSKRFAAEVLRDIYEASQAGAKGVPFFVFDRKYALSGAQESTTFLKALYQVKAESQNQ